MESYSLVVWSSPAKCTHALLFWIFFLLTEAVNWSRWLTHRFNLMWPKKSFSPHLISSIHCPPRKRDQSNCLGSHTHTNTHTPIRQWRSTCSATMRMPTFPLAVPPATPMMKGSRFEIPFPAGSPGIVSLSASMLHLRGDASLWDTGGLYPSHLTPPPLLMRLMRLMNCSLEEGKKKNKKNKKNTWWNVRHLCVSLIVEVLLNLFFPPAAESLRLYHEEQLKAHHWIKVFFFLVYYYYFLK